MVLIEIGEVEIVFGGEYVYVIFKGEFFNLMGELDVNSMVFVYK